MIGRCIGDIVNEVLLVCVGQFRGFIMGYFREDQGGKRGCSAGGGGSMFGQDGSTVGNAGAVFWQDLAFNTLNARSSYYLL